MIPVVINCDALEKNLDILVYFFLFIEHSLYLYSELFISRRSIWSKNSQDHPVLLIVYNVTPTVDQEFTIYS